VIYLAHFSHIRSLSLHWQLPLSLLRAAKGSAILIELKSGETYNGHLVATDAYMNVTVADVICTAASGDRFWKLPQANIRGAAIKYLRLPETCLDLAMEEEKQQQLEPRGGGRRGGATDGPRGGGRGGRHTYQGRGYNASGGRGGRSGDGGRGGRSGGDGRGYRGSGRGGGRSTSTAGRSSNR
jgi:U6 snRNA-associated Sm-like protein LSm4